MKPRQIKKNSKSAMELLIKVFGSDNDNFSLEPNSVLVRNKEVEFRSWVLWCGYYDDADSYEAEEVLFNCVLWEHEAWSKIERSYDIINNCPLHPIPHFTFNELITECRKLAKAGVILR